MSALENAKKLSNEQVLEKIAALDIQEYGLCAQKLSERLEAAVAESKEEGKESAMFYHEKVMPSMEALRTPVDELEMIVDKDMWPMPSYGDLLFDV